MSKTATVRVRIEPELEKFEVPNRTTLETFAATDAGKDLIECEDSEEMFSRLRI